MRSLSRAAARGTIAAVDPEHRRALDSQDRHRWLGPEHVADAAVADQRHPIEYGGVASELLRRIQLTLPGLGVVEPSDCGVAAVVPESCQHRDQRSERIGCGATKHSKVHFRLERLTKLAWLRPDIADLTRMGEFQQSSLRIRP